jgi:hypothetical protein
MQENSTEIYEKEEHFSVRKYHLFFFFTPRGWLQFFLLLLTVGIQVNL